MIIMTNARQAVLVTSLVLSPLLLSAITALVAPNIEGSWMFLGVMASGLYGIPTVLIAGLTACFIIKLLSKDKKLSTKIIIWSFAIPAILVSLCAIDITLTASQNALSS